MQLSFPSLRYYVLLFSFTLITIMDCTEKQINVYTIVIRKHEMFLVALTSYCQFIPAPEPRFIYHAHGSWTYVMYTYICVYRLSVGTYRILRLGTVPIVCNMIIRNLYRVCVLRNPFPETYSAMHRRVAAAAAAVGRGRFYVRLIDRPACVRCQTMILSDVSIPISPWLNTQIPVQRKMSGWHVFVFLYFFLFLIKCVLKQNVKRERQPVPSTLHTKHSYYYYYFIETSFEITRPW